MTVRFGTTVDVDSEPLINLRDPVGAQDADTKAARQAAIATAIEPLASDADVASAIGLAIAAQNLGTAALKDFGTGNTNLPTVATVDTKIQAAVTALLNGAGGAYDTLKELQDLIVSDVGALNALAVVVSGKLVAANNLSDVANAATALANLGGSPLGHPHVLADVTGLIAALAGKLSLTGGILTGPATSTPGTLAYSGATFTPDAGAKNLYRGVLTQATTVADPVNPQGDGQVLRLEFTQNATGGFTIAFGSKYIGSDDLAIPQPATGPSKRTVYTFEYDLASTKWLLLGKNAGFQL